MSPAPATGDQRVLHIRPEPTGGVTTDNLDRELAANELPFDTCPDVYRGLARLCAAADRGYSIAVVLVDALGDPEMEFFSIAARACSTTTVYVYGDERLKARMADACERGASGVVTPKTLKGLMATTPMAPTVSANVTSTPSQEPASLPSASQADGTDEAVEWDADGSAASIEQAALAPPVSDEVSDSLEPGDHTHDGTTPRSSIEVDSMGVEAAGDEPFLAVDDDVEPDLETNDELPDEADSDSPDVRVPWLRYGSTPGRTAPQPRGPRTNESHSDAEPRRPSILREPLLTDEELRALLGDDDFGSGEATSRTPPNAVSEDEGDRS